MMAPVQTPAAAGRHESLSGVIYNLQALRALAASLVVFYHVQRSAGRISGHPYHTDFGAFGVDIFFVISGFIMFRTTAGFRRTGVEFVMDRMIRVAPLYWIATIALYGLYLLGFRPNGLHLAMPLDLLSSMVLLPRELPNGTSPVLLGLGWTLVYEMLFYLLFAATFFMRSHARSFAVLCILFLGLALLPQVIPDLPFTLRYFTNTIIFEFLLGAGLALATSRLRTGPSKMWLVAGCILTALGFAAVIDVPIQHLDKGLSLDSRAFRAGLPALAVVTGALIAEHAGYRCKWRPVVLLGGASYALYLFHPFVLQPAMKIFERLVPADGLWVLIAANLFAFAASACVGIGVHLLIEQPIMARLKKRKPHESKAAQHQSVARVGANAGRAAANSL